jgi:murein L,D-transpeptidase YcbB/YkuD
MNKYLNIFVSFFLMFSVWDCSSAKRPAETAKPDEKVLDSKESILAKHDKLLTDLQELIKSEKERDAEALAQREKIFPAELKKQPMFKKLTKEIREELKGEYFFTGKDGLLPRGQILIDAVRDMASHGFSETQMEKYPVNEISELPDRLVKKQEEYKGCLKKIADSNLCRAFEELSAAGSIPSKEELYDKIVAGLHFSDQTGAELGNFVKLKDSLRAGLLEIETARAGLEVLLFVSFFSYVLDFKYLIAAHPFRAEKEPEKADVKFHDQLFQAFGDASKDFEATMKSLIPKSPYYELLRDQLKFYRKIVENGGIKPIQIGRKLKPGMSGNDVKTLKERLFLEGYYAGSIDNKFDSLLEEAFKLYQHTHQFNGTGIFETKMLKSLNVSMEKRANAIALSLQRIRESSVNHEDPVHIRVNIPEFHMEVWEGKTLKLKHKIVVGNNNWDKNPDDRIEGRINRTKLFSAKVAQVILNPLWHVPARIKKLELDRELWKEPDFYTKHKYKVKVLADGTEEVFQETCPENALGKVKLVFPNKYNIFMHDTPDKKYFLEEIRSFSHGCIRLDNPMEVAYYILFRDQGYTKEKVDEIRNVDWELQIDLKEKIPINVEYNTVSIDLPTSKAMFFYDVYNYDRDYWDGKIPYSEEELRLLERKINKID